MLRTRIAQNQEEETKEQMPDPKENMEVVQENTTPDSEKIEEQHTEPQEPTALQELVQSDGVEEESNISLKKILGGDILTTDWIKRQLGLFVLCLIFIIIYITNRYSAQQETIELEKLKIELQEIKYHALTRSSELTVKTRQSQVEDKLKQTKDSMLTSPKEPPFLIKTK